MSDQQMFHDQVMAEKEQDERDAEMQEQLEIYRHSKPLRVEIDEYLESQAALPEHKRDGYAERMAEQADMLRKEKRENG